MAESGVQIPKSGSGIAMYWHHRAIDAENRIEKLSSIAEELAEALGECRRRTTIKPLREVADVALARFDSLKSEVGDG